VVLAGEQKTPEAARRRLRWAEKTGTGFTLPGHQQAAAEASNGKPDKLLQFRSRLENREDQTEVRANSFAAAFLMPESGVREFLSGVGKSQDVPTLQEVYDEEGDAVRAQRRGSSQPLGLQFYDIAHLAFYFGVSYEAALWRLKSFQIISEEERESLAQKQTAASAFRKVLGDRFSRHRDRFTKHESTLRHKLLSMALEAFRLGEISKAKLKEIASGADVSSGEFNALLGGIEVESPSVGEEVRIPN